MIATTTMSSTSVKPPIEVGRAGGCRQALYPRTPPARKAVRNIVLGQIGTGESSPSPHARALPKENRGQISVRALDLGVAADEKRHFGDELRRIFLAKR